MISYSQWIRQMYRVCIHINKEMKFLQEVAWEFNRVWARILNSQESYFWGQRPTISPSSDNMNYLKPIYVSIYLYSVKLG